MGTEATSRSMMDINDASENLAKMGEDLIILVNHFKI
jgi:methyl-accepting chemotaxis protein